MKTKWKWIVWLAGAAGACAALELLPRDASLWLSGALIAPLIYMLALGTRVAGEEGALKRTAAELGAMLGFYGICWSVWAWFAGDLSSTSGWLTAAFTGLLLLSAIVEGLRHWPNRRVGIGPEPTAALRPPKGLPPPRPHQRQRTPSRAAYSQKTEPVPTI
jgi:hypothetical protein